MKHVISSVLLLTLALAARAADKQPFQVSGLYTETCACSAPCKCELTGDVPPTCQGVGALKLTSGMYAGQDLSGVSTAYAGKPGSWIRIYIDAPDAAHREAAEKFMRAAFAEWGTIEAVKDAKIEISGTYGAYTVTVNGGDTMKYSTVPILGSDGKTAVAHTNTFNPVTHTFLQGKSADATSYHDGDRSIMLDQGRNAYFNDKMETSGQL
ncbi:MAG TPA: DUF1326 domain-containing protein [Opitutaceae bacterium]|nr:DUF1326 domain-containing protein [Opitutaceae bacterium]